MKKKLVKQVLFRSVKIYVGSTTKCQMFGLPDISRAADLSPKDSENKENGKDPEVEKGACFPCTFEVLHKGKGKANGKIKGSKGKTKELVLADWAQGKGKQKTKFKSKKGPKEKAIPQKRQAFLRLKPMIANVKNQPTPHSLRCGRLIVLVGTGRQKLTGMTPKLITMTGTTPRIGSSKLVGLPQLFRDITHERIS